jgi:hypothetical protein
MERKWSASDIGRWLRRRRKIRHAAQTGENVSPGDPDFYGADFYGDEPVDDRFPMRSLLSVIAVLIAVTMIGYLMFGTLGGSDDDEIIGSPPATEAPASTDGTAAPPSSDAAPPSSDVAPPSSDPAPDPLAEVMRKILFDLGLTETGTYDELVEAVDLLNDLIDSIRLVLPAYDGRDVDIARVVALLYQSGQLFQDNGFNNSVYECGAIDPVVVCPPAVRDMPAGTTLVVAMEVDADIAVASSDQAYRYSIVFDTDGDPANDWVYVDPFEWDYFQGADRWYQAVYDPSFGWNIEVTQLTADGSIPAEAAPSAARAVIEGPWIVWFIPVEELGGAPAPFRVSAFAHDGTFSESSRGGDVLGADPTGSLFDPPLAPVFVVED